jgi:hypothetical protein
MAKTKHSSAGPPSFATSMAAARAKAAALQDGPPLASTPKIAAAPRPAPGFFMKLRERFIGAVVVAAVLGLLALLLLASIFAFFWLFVIGAVVVGAGAVLLALGWLIDVLSKERL